MFALSCVAYYSAADDYSEPDIANVCLRYSKRSRGSYRDRVCAQRFEHDVSPYNRLISGLIHVKRTIVQNKHNSALELYTILLTLTGPTLFVFDVMWTLG